MIHVEHRVRIYRPVAEVFRFAGDPANDPHWAGSVLDSRRVTDGPLGVGTRFRQQGKFLAVRTDAESEVTAFEPDRRICLGGQEGEARGFDCREFAAEGPDTWFSRTTEADVGGMFRMAEALVAVAARRQIEADMELLKILLDARAEPDPQA